MKKVITVIAALTGMGLTDVACASAVGMYDFGPADNVGVGYTIINQTVVAKIDGPSTNYNHTTSGSAIHYDSGLINGASAFFHSDQIFNSGTFMRLNYSAPSLNAASDILMFEEWTAEISIAPGGWFTDDPLVHLDVLDAPDAAYNFAEAMVSVYANTGAGIFNQSQSLFIDSSSALPGTDAGIHVRYDNATDHEVIATFTLFGEIGRQTVPEPASIALVLSCLGLLGLTIRYRKS